MICVNLIYYTTKTSGVLFRFQSANNRQLKNKTNNNYIINYNALTGWLTGMFLCMP